jgi:hypothetical protein
MPSMDWRRRHALQIAAQLPDNVEDALMVLELARSLVDGFLVRPLPLPQSQPEGVVLAFPEASGANFKAS